MEKIVLFTFVVLAAVLMVNAENATTTAMPSTTAQVQSNVTAAPGNTTSTATPEVTTAKPPVTAAAAIQPLAIFVLACAFLGLMH